MALTQVEKYDDELHNLGSKSAGRFHSTENSNQRTQYKRGGLAFVRQLPLKTEIPESDDNTELSATNNKLKVVAAQYELRAVPLSNEVKGVIASIDEGGVKISCTMPNGKVSVDLPLALVPEELQVYGLPVMLSLDVVNGYKKLVVTKRHPEQSANIKAMLTQIDSWLASE